MLRAAAESKLRRDEDGRLALVIEADHGETLVEGSDLRMASRLREVWSIDRDEIADAAADILWQRSLACDGWSVSTRVETRMRADAAYFYVTMKLAAFEGDARVFEREFHDSVRRDPDTDTSRTTKTGRQSCLMSSTTSPG
jgi:hypothetical protein